MKISLISHTFCPENIVAAAAKICYSPVGIDDIFDGLDENKSADFVKMLASYGHESPTEHVTFTFGIEGVSRSFLAQITRHRIASYSVQSQRYVKENGFEFVTPPEIAQNPKALELYNKHMENTAKLYDELSEILKNKHYSELIRNNNELTEKEEKSALSAAEKSAIEDARYVLPNACETKMIVTFNVRSLHNFFRHRMCNRAQWEIRQAATEMYKLAKKNAPALFEKAGAPCAHGKCPEGKMKCKGKKS